LYCPYLKQELDTYQLSTKYGAAFLLPFCQPYYPLYSNIFPGHRSRPSPELNRNLFRFLPAFKWNVWAFQRLNFIINSKSKSFENYVQKIAILKQNLLTLKAERQAFKTFALLKIKVWQAVFAVVLPFQLYINLT
jgi:hypothetical protein